MSTLFFFSFNKELIAIISDLDEIFNEIITIDENHISYINVRLIIPSDNKDIFEVIDIEGVNSPIAIKGLGDSYKLEVGSWIRKNELKGLERQNKNIRFIIEAV